MKLLAYMHVALIAVIALSAASSEVTAQVWSVDAYAGRAKYNLEHGSVPSNMGALGIRFNQDRRIFQAALGLPLSDTDMTWGIVGFGDRFAIRRGGFLAGADVSILGHAQRDPVANIAGQGISAELLPTIAQSFGAATLQIRSGPRWYGSRLGDASWTRTLWTSDFRLNVRVADRLWLESKVRHDRSGENEAYTRVGFSAVTMLGPVAIEGSLGKWTEVPNDNKLEWGASLAVPISSRVWIFTTAQHETFNPQFLSAPRTSWGAGITFRIGRDRTTRAAAPEISPKGRVVIRISIREVPAPPSIAGDFTGWKPVPMERHGNEWHYSVDVPPGVYRYAFRSADGEWFVPQSIPNRIDDGMGGWVAVLVVP